MHHSERLKSKLSYDLEIISFCNNVSSETIAKNQQKRFTKIPDDKQTKSKQRWRTGKKLTELGDAARSIVHPSTCWLQSCSAGLQVIATLLVTSGDDSILKTNWVLNTA
eukprot:c12836_g1_i2.p2 GENE.c12836_g1_i2~~c12836_g1_i2.p2  ORF type:complete len:109 (-),score=12.70 c12836_g1_i2:146-472(-)